MEDAVQKFKKIDAFFSTNEAGVFAAVGVLEQEKRLQGTYIYAVGGCEAETELIKAGKETGSSAQLPYKMGYEGGKVMLDVLAGKPVTQFKTLIDPLFISKDYKDLATYNPGF
jgi:ABC-type sugar transport system substrate-binding protein